MPNGKQVFAHVPIRNPFGFERVLFIDGDFGKFLLIPKSIFPSGPYSNDDWINRKTVYFPGQDSYLLVTAGEENQRQAIEARLLKAVGPVIFEVNTKFQTALAPHAMTARELIPESGTLEGGAIEISPEFQPDQFHTDPFMQRLLNSLVPYYADDGAKRAKSLILLLNRQRNLGESTTLDELVEIINQVNFTDFYDHAAGTLGSFILNYLEDNLPDADKDNIRKVWGDEALKRLQDPTLGPMLGDFLADYHGKENVNRFQDSPRRYDEFGNFDGPVHRPSKIDINAAPTPVRESFSLKQKMEFLEEQQVRHIQTFVHNLLYDIRTERSHAKTFADMKSQFSKIKIEELQIKDRGWNDERLSYYLEAFSASRPGIKFLHLYQVVESLTTRGQERQKLKDLFNHHFLSANDLDPELTEFMKNFSPPAPFNNTKLVIKGKTLDDVVESIYCLRCMISHSRERDQHGGAEHRIVPYSRHEYEIVPEYFPLMDKIAAKFLAVP